MKLDHITSIIFILGISLFKDIESYPRIQISKHAKIYRTFKSLNILQENEYLAEEQWFADSEVCNSTVCQIAGKALKANLNASVDPCDDFYEFACGGWMASHTIPDEKSVYFGDEEIQDAIIKKINQSLSQPRSANDPKVLIFASDLYKSCTDNSTREQLGVAPLKTAMNILGGWPMTSNSTFNEKTYDWKESFATVVAKFGYNPIFAFGVGSDANDTKVNRFNFAKPGFGLGRNQLLNQTQYSKVVGGYKKLILRTAVLLGAKNDSQTRQQIDEIVNFEAILANETLAKEESRTADVWYNKMSFEDFNQLTNNTIDWLNLINNIYSKINSKVRVKSDELVIVSDIDYFKAVTQIIEKTPKRVIANYLNWVVATQLGSLTNQAFRTAGFEFSQITRGVVKDSELWEDCVYTVSSIMEYATSRLYIDTSFSKKDKEVASVMVNDIKESFDDLIRQSDWLDNSTRSKALYKLNAIQQNVGYPDWVREDKELDKYYNLTKKADHKTFFANMRYLTQTYIPYSYDSLREAVNLNTSWPMPPQEVNAAYEPTQNSITIPAAQLNPPYFDVRLPAYVNYGAIGAVIGHEFTHGFDDEGSEFDADGNLRNWWTEDVADRFNERADCFINEYSSYLDAQTDLKLDGNNTVGENIADNGGIREAYNAYLKYVKRHGKQQRLPHINQYSPEQQFFISYGNTWCTKYRTEYLENLIQYDPHSPAKYRVNVPLSNFKAFSDVFKCSANSQMNRKNKCVLW